MPPPAMIHGGSFGHGRHQPRSSRPRGVWLAEFFWTRTIGRTCHYLLTLSVRYNITICKKSATNAGRIAKTAPFSDLLCVAFVVLLVMLIMLVCLPGMVACINACL